MNRIARAREILPLPRLLQKIGLGQLTASPYRGECPFCKKKGGKFGVFEHQGHWFFKCHSTDCAASDHEGGHNEIGFLILYKQFSEKDAIAEFMRLASEVDPSLAIQDKEQTAQEQAPAASSDAAQGKPQNIWHDLWQRLALNSNHKDQLKSKRGYTEQTISALGFRSSIPGNRAILDAMAESWPMEALLENGIFIKDKRETRPNPQLCGLGITGKKNSDGDSKMDWTHPIIIPYLDEQGIPYYLRPHKGGLKQQHADEFYKKKSGGHVYCPFLLSSLVAENRGTCIVTEGEHKAGALWQCRIPAVAIPGIQFTRSRSGDISMPEYRFRDELVRVLREHGVTDVVVVFDNEVKDDPAFPEKYKPDPWDRYDTAVWAEYLAIDLRDEFESVRLGQIPDEFRIKGKADFDSTLSGFVNGVILSDKTRHTAFEMAHGEKEGNRKARRTFLKIIDDAAEKRSYHELFATSARRIINCKLERLFYKPLVPRGGDTEEHLVRRFLQPNPFDGGKPIASDLADAFKQTRGCYYARGSVDAKMAKYLRAQIDAFDSEISKEDSKESGKNIEHLRALRSLKAASWERLKGMPEPLSDFTIACEYKLHTSDGKTIRLVRIKNKQGQVNERLLRLTGTDMCRSSNFREWAYDTGLGVPKFGEKDLQNLVEDMDHHAAFRDIYEINTYGWHPTSNLWFYGDCAITPDGAILKNDDQGIIWYEGIGYQVEAPVDDESSTGFEQSAPWLLSPHGVCDPFEGTDTELFERMAEDFHEMIGGYDAWMGIGIFAAAAFAPEMLREKGGQPGLFLHGNLSEGKTTVMRLMMRLQGFRHLDGLSIEPTTEVAMARALSHYSCLFVWFDEFREKNLRERPGKLTIIRDAFNRGGAAKGYANDPRKTRIVRPNTTAIVTGESSSSDSATRSRFALIHISRMRYGANSKESLARAQKDSPHYFRIWRHIMVNRAAFAKRGMEILRTKMEEYKDRIPNERIRFVHIAALAGFTALGESLQACWSGAEHQIKLEQEIVAIGIKALADVVEETFLQAFWRHVISGIQNIEIKKTFFKTRVVVKEEKSYRQVTEAEIKSGVGIEVCYLNFHPIYDSYAMYIRKQGLTPPLSAKDLRSSMGSERWCMGTNAICRFKDGSEGSVVKSVMISLESDDGFPYLDELKELLSDSRDGSASEK